MGVFERFLSVWVALAIGAGVLLGNLAPSIFNAIAAANLWDLCDFIHCCTKVEASAQYRCPGLHDCNIQLF